MKERKKGRREGKKEGGTGEGKRIPPRLSFLFKQRIKANLTNMVKNGNLLFKHQVGSVLDHLLTTQVTFLF